METVRLRSKIGNDGHLRVDIPTMLPQGEVDIVLVVVPSSDESSENEYPVPGLEGKLQWNGEAVGDGDEEHDNWMQLSAQGLAGAYSEDEPEYTADLIKEPNPGYEAR